MSKTTTTTAAATQSAAEAVEVQAFRSPLRDMTEALSDLVSIAEIAHRLDKSQPNVHQMLKGKGAPGAIEGPVLGQRGKLYSWAEVEDFMDRKAAKRAASLQKTIDAATRAQERADKAAEKAKKAREEWEARQAQAEAEAEREEEEAPILAEVEEDAADTLDLGDDWEDVEVDEDDEAARAAAEADMEDEDTDR